jgi:ESF2/ABP1 family protein
VVLAAHEGAVRTARLRLELSQSRTEQRDYLKNVELARVLDKRAERKRAAGKEVVMKPSPSWEKRGAEGQDDVPRKRNKRDTSSLADDGKRLDTVLKSIF